MRRKFAATAAAVALGAFAFAAPAGAAGGNGASFCSNSGAPDGVVNPEDPTTWANAGEVVSYLVPQSPFAPEDAPGKTVKAFCNPNQANGEN
jgi:hypothetical protein